MGSPVLQRRKLRPQKVYPKGHQWLSRNWGSLLPSDRFGLDELQFSGFF